MKKSILILSVLLPTLAHSGTPDKKDAPQNPCLGGYVFNKEKGACEGTADTKPFAYKSQGTCYQGFLYNKELGICEVVADSSKSDIVAGASASQTSTSSATTTATTTDTKPAPKTEPSLMTVSTLDLKDAKLALAFNADQVQITGSLPKECADRISLSDLVISAPKKSTDDIESIAVKKPDDLNDYATKIDIQVAFQKDDAVPSLKACLANASPDSPKVDLSKSPLCTRTALLNPDSDIAIAGIVGESATLSLKSKGLLDILSQIKTIGCDKCNKTWDKLYANLTKAKSLDSPFLKTMITSIFDNALVDMDKTVEDAKSLDDLEKASDQLAKMSEFINSADERNLQLTLMEKIAARGKELNTNHGHKITDSVACKTADFERNMYKKMASLDGLSDDKREEYKTLAAELAPGQATRLQFLSSIDPNNHEIRDHLRNTAKEDKDLNSAIQDKTMQMQRNCMGAMMQYNFTLCGALQNDIRGLQAQDAQLKAQDAQLQSNYTVASNDNWNGIFSTWQKDGVSYDHSFFGSLIQPVRPTTQYGLGNTSQTLPQVYNPRDPQYANLTSMSNVYSNFNGNQYYQSTANQGSMNAFYNAQIQQGTSRPASYRPF